MLKRVAQLQWMLGIVLVGCGPSDQEEQADLASLCPVDDPCEVDPGNNGVDDFPNSFGSAISVSLGDNLSDEINSNTDIDYFKFFQGAGVVTRVSIDGANCTLHYRTGTSPYWAYPQTSFSDTNPSPSICFIHFVPTASGTWWIKVRRTDGVINQRWEGGATKPCGYAFEHSPTVEGAPLPNAGGAECCVETVCATDSFCCNSWWDGLCVSEAHNWCGLQ